MNFLQGRVQFEQKKYSDALNAFNKVEVKDLAVFEHYELAYKKGFCLMKQNTPEQALIFFEKATVSPNPYKNASLYYTGHIYYTLQQNEKAIASFNQIKSNASYKKIISYYMLQIDYRNGNYAEVTEKGKELLKSADTKKRAEILPLLADASFKTNDLDAALEYYLQLEKQSRNQLTRQDLYQMGLIRYQSGKYKEAIVSFQKLNGDSDSLDQHAAYLLAQCYLKTDQKIFARTAFLSAYKNDQDKQLSIDALLNYARLSQETGSDPYNEATTLLQQFLEKNPQSSHKKEVHQLLVQLYLTTKNYDAALQSLESNKNDPEMQAVYEQLLFSLAIDLFNQGQYEKSISYFKKINSSANPLNSAAAIFWTAESYYRLKNFVDAQSNYKKFFAHRSASKTDLLQLATYNLGYCYFQLKQYPSALQSFKQYLSNPLSDQPKITADATCRIGDCYFINKEYSKAIEAYKPIIAVRQSETDYALFQTAMAFGALGKYNEKIAHLDRVVKQHNQSPYYDQALYEMGSTNLIMNDSRSAIAMFDKLVKERPRSGLARESMLKIGLIYFNNNQNQEAITSLRKVAESYPGTPDAREALNTLKVIYMENNAIEEYFSLTKKLGFGQMSNSEQDSLAFIMAENFYTENRFQDAENALKSYVSTYPEGTYQSTAQHYLSKIYLKSDPQKALSYLRFLIDNPKNPYLEEALLEAARIYYDNENYQEAQKAYENLLTITSQPLQKTEALEGVMKCFFFTGDFSQAVSKAENLLNDPNASPNQTRQAHYIAGKSLFESKDYTKAKGHLMEVQRSGNDALGAEAYYLIARISYENNFLDDAENQLFDLSEKFRHQEYWVAKGFLLLADIYVKNNNIFQAKETLKSIVDNYKGDDLRQEASRKLSMLK
jgi:TolA-binding protein